MKEKEDDYLEMRQITEYIHLQRAAIYAAMKKGRLKGKKIDGRWKISRRDLDIYRLTKYDRDIRTVNGQKLFCPEKGTFSVNQCAKIVSDELKRDYAMQRVYYLIRTGQLRCHKVGATFIVRREDLIDLIEKEKRVQREDYRQLQSG
jgi:hypothetical protein